MEQSKIKEMVLAIESSKKLNAIFEEGINAANEEKVSELQDMFNNAKNVALVSVHVHKPTLNVNLGVNLPDDIPEDVGAFCSKSESGLKFTGFTDQFKKLESIEKCIKNQIKQHSITDTVKMMTLEGFEQFFEKYKDYQMSWNDVVEEIRTIYSSDLEVFRTSVNWRIKNDIAKGNPQLEEMLTERLNKTLGKTADEFCSRLYLELDSEFSPEQFEDEELKKFLSVSQIEKQKKQMRCIIEGLISKSFEASCSYLLAVAKTQFESLISLNGRNSKFSKSAKEIAKANIFEIDCISEISREMKRISNINYTEEAFSELLTLLKDIYFVATKYGVELDMKKLPNCDSLILTESDLI